MKADRIAHWVQQASTVRIAYDEQAFQIQRFGGVSRYITRVAEELVREGEDVHVFAPLHQNEYLRNSFVPKSVLMMTRGFPAKSGRLIRWFNRYLSARQITGWTPDVLHETYFHPLRVERSRVPTVVTVHDMIPEKFPELVSDCGRSSYEKRQALTRAQHVICVSRATQKDLCELWDYPVERTTVVHHGVDVPRHQPAEEGAGQSRRPFILYVGLRHGYKNFRALLSAVGSSGQLRGAFDIVAFGGPQFSKRERADPLWGVVAPSKVIYGGQDDRALENLYRRAAVFVYPSLYEGFGMPLLEAMVRGCPIVASSEGSCPEVAGDGAEYFNARSSEDLSRAIQAVVFSPTRRRTLVRNGRYRVASFTWNRCALQTRSVYSRAAYGD